MEVKVNKEKKGYSASIFDIGVFTQGENFEDLLVNLEDALLTHYAEEVSNKKSILPKLKFLEKAKTFKLII